MAHTDIEDTGVEDAAPQFCDQCGKPTAAVGEAEAKHAGADAHSTCAARRELEPPRYCPRCARRMVVQILPTGWTARCSAHGELTSAAAAVS
ncbi:MAG TPA: hypothetical protein VGM10_16030 [Actinocrinis sp.]